MPSGKRSAWHSLTGWNRFPVVVLSDPSGTTSWCKTGEQVARIQLLKGWTGGDG